MIVDERFDLELLKRFRIDDMGGYAGRLPIPLMGDRLMLGKILNDGSCAVTYEATLIHEKSLGLPALRIDTSTCRNIDPGYDTKWLFDYPQRSMERMSLSKTKDQNWRMELLDRARPDPKDIAIPESTEPLTQRDEKRFLELFHYDASLIEETVNSEKRPRIGDKGQISWMGGDGTESDWHPFLIDRHPDTKLPCMKLGYKPMDWYLNPNQAEPYDLFTAFLEDATTTLFERKEPDHEPAWRKTRTPIARQIPLW